MLTGQARAGGMHVAQDAKSLYDIAKLARRVREGYAWDLEAAKRAHDAGVLTGPFPTRPLASLSASNVLPPSAPTLSLPSLSCACALLLLGCMCSFAS